MQGRVRLPRRSTAALCLYLLAASLPAFADEPDPFLVLEEARAISEAWERCAVAFVKSRLPGQQSAERLAEEALSHCQRQAARLNAFVVERMGKASAENVMAFVREKFRTDLTEVIEELRRRQSK